MRPPSASAQSKILLLLTSVLLCFGFVELGLRVRTHLFNQTAFEAVFSSDALPPAESAPAPVFWDRLQWQLADFDLRPFVADLPWSEIDAVALVGGASPSPLALMILCEALRVYRACLP